MKLRRVVFAIFVLLLITACDSKDNRAAFDKEIGKIETSNYSFSSNEGMLHITQHDDVSLRLRATSSVFGAQITNKSSSPLELKLTITNINEDLSLTDQNQNTIPVSNQLSSLVKEWVVVVAAGETINLNSSTPQPGSFNFLAMGDIQDGIKDFDTVIEKINQQTDVDFMLFLGDLTMNSSAEEFDKVVAAFEKIKFPIYSTPGNHDVSRSELRYQQYFGRANYHFKHKGVFFTSLDSGSWSLSEQTWNWYLAWLDEAISDTHIVFSHIAPTESFGIRGGQWKSRREANTFIAHSSIKGVDAMFFGHLHTLDIFRLAGIPTYISGGAGAFPERLDGIARHFLKVNVIAETSEVKVMVVKVD